MRRCLSIASLAATLAFSAPAVVLRPIDQAGYRSMLASRRGKVVLVNFWATWCAPCREEMPALVALEKKLQPKGLVLVTVSADEPEQSPAAAAFLAKHGVHPPAYLKKAPDDQAFINAVSREWTGALPATFLYDKNGRLARTFIGETKTQTLEDEILKLVGR